MMNRRAVLLAFALLPMLAGCGGDVTIRALPAQLPGSYYSGDGLGRNVTVVLAADGRFSSNWQGCLGLYGQAHGTWQLDGERLLFNPLDEDDALAGYLREATTVRHEGRFGFARDADVRGGRIDERLLFLRAVEPPR